MYSFIFLGDRDKKKILDDLSSKIQLHSLSYQVIFLTTKKINNEKLSDTFRHINFKTVVFKESATAEEMFETIIHAENLGTIILFKDSARNINFADVNRMLDQNSKGAKIVVSKQLKKDNFFIKIFSSIKNFFVKIFLGFKLFAGEADIILIDSILASTLAQMDGRSGILTKVNAWSGIEPKTVTIDTQPKRENNQISFKNFMYTIIWGSLLLLMLIGNILFSVLNVNLTFLGMFAYIVVEVGIFGVLLYSLTRALFRAKFGRVGTTIQSEIIEVINNFDE